MAAGEDGQQILDRRRRLDGLEVAGHGTPDRLGEPLLATVDRQQDVGLVDNADDRFVLHHRKLRDVGELHPVVGGQHLLVGADHHGGALAVAARYQVAQVAAPLALDEALVVHPVVVEHLREIFVAAVADEGDDALGLRLGPAVFERAGDQRAGRRAGQDAFPAQQGARGLERRRVGDGDGLVDAREIAHRGHEVLADALDLPRAGDLADGAGAHVLGQDGAGRVRQHNGHVRGGAREEAAEPGDGAARADTADHGVEVVVHLLPNLRRGRFLVGLGVGGVAELVDVERVVAFVRQPLGQVLVVFRVALGDIGPGQHDLRAHGAQVEDFLLAHLVGDDQDQAVALLPGDQGEPEPGIAGRGLDEGAARLDAAVALGRLDHAECGPVLDRAARILVLQLDEQPARPGIEGTQLDHRGVADGLEHVGVGVRRRHAALRQVPHGSG